MTNRSRHAKEPNMMYCRRPLILSSVVAVAAFSLLAAGCGGGGSPGVASVASSTTAATTTTQNGADALVPFSRCMRSHGVPTFPDPSTIHPQALKATVQQLAAGNPRFPAAQRACNHLLPNGGSGSQEAGQQSRTRLADMLSFARCMRSHGVSRFPDPSAQSGLTVEMVQAQGIDVRSPAVLRVVGACLPATHGALTPAKVREALNNAGG
jgi:hypothetical protein